MNHISTSAADRRQDYRLAIHKQARIMLAFDGPEPEDEAIHGVTLTDISSKGLMAADAGRLIPGAKVLLEVPLVGWHEAEVRWIAENRAGCRFIRPLTLDELRLAAASSERLAGEFPDFAAEIGSFTITDEQPGASTASRTVVPSIWNGPTSVATLAAITVVSFFCATWLLDQLF